MNKIIILGRLTKDVEIKNSQNGTLVGKFTLAVPRKYVKEGEERKVDFINITAFGKSAEFAGKYFKKGLQVLVTGRMEINQYEDENGEKQYLYQIIAEEFDFADTKKINDDSTTNNTNSLADLIDNNTFSSSDELPF